MAILTRVPKKTILFILFLILVYAAAGFFGVPILAEKYLPDQASRLLGKKVSFQSFEFNPMMLTATVHGLDIQDKDKPIVSVEKLKAGVGISSIFMLAPVVSQITVDQPVIHLVRETDGTFNFSDWVVPESKPSTQGADGKMEDTVNAKVPEFILKNVTISQGNVFFEDKLKSVTHQMRDLSFFLPFLSNKPNKKNEKSGMDINFIINDSGVDIHAESTPFADNPSSRFLIKTQDIDVIPFLPYLDIPGTMKIKTLGINTDVELFCQKKNKHLAVDLQGKINALNGDVTDAVDTDLATFRLLALDILQTDIFSGQFNLGNVTIDSPHVNLNRDAEGRVTLGAGIRKPENNPQPQLQPSAQSTESSPGPGSPAEKNPFSDFHLSLYSMDLKNGSLDFKDASNSTLFQTRLSPVTLHLENVSIGESVSGTYTLALETEAKEKMDSAGQLMFNPFKAKGNLTVSDLFLKKYVPYFESKVNAAVESSRISLSSSFDIQKTQDSLSGGIKVPEFLIRALSVLNHPGGEQMMDLPTVYVKNTNVDLGQHQVTADEIKVEKGRIKVERMKNHRFNLAEILDAGSGGSTDSAGSESSAKAAGDNWQISLPVIDVSGLGIDFIDAACKDPVKIALSNISVKAEGISTQKDKTGTIAVNMDWNNKGKINVKGNIHSSLKLADLDVGLDNIDIQSLQPYFTDAVKVVVTDGLFHTNGKLNLDFTHPSGQAVRFTGKSSVTGFACRDKLNGDEFFTAKSLYAAGLDISVMPVKLRAKEISLTDFYSRIVISPAGELNLSSVFNPGSDQGSTGVNKEKPDAAIQTGSEKNNAASAFPDIAFDRVTLQGGDIQFSDYLTRPNFTTGMKALTGLVTGLSSNPDSKADLNLKGIHGKSSPLEIIGKINPLAPTKFADINVSFKDIELTNFSPYAAKYLGYKIEKGKLIMDLDYLIKGNRLESENRFMFDNFALGDQVESKDAVSLPVELAITLLTDQNGRINLDLPVTGDLGDPEFKIGKIIFKMIGKLILKAATSPFALIGSIFDGAQDLESLDFKQGESIILPENYKKIDRLTKILDTKPSLKLEIQGMYDKEKDAQRLKLKGYRELVRAEKIKQMLASGSAAPSSNEVIVTKEEMPIYIYLAYTKAGFPKPVDETGVEKQISVEEKKNLLISNIHVTDEDLARLADRRAENVKAYILSNSNVGDERIFMLAPVDGQKTGDKDKSRVRFVLR